MCDKRSERLPGLKILNSCFLNCIWLCIAGPQHPNPGKSYSPLYISAFLPHNSEGKEICDLLQTAFEAGLLFTIGTSPSTGEENKIIWNDIELKTSQSGGPAR